jgi:hypothetical protein
MAQGHFVAQTYLRQWADPSPGMLRRYGKRTGKEFPCAPKNVCREWNWVCRFGKKYSRLTKVLASTVKLRR